MTSIRTLLLASLLVCGIPALAGAQDKAPLETDIFKVALDNERIRVLNATFKPGAKTAPHSRPNHMIYMLTDGTLVFSPVGKTPYEATFKAGDAMWFPALTHGLENAGDKDVRIVITEVKEAARAAPAKATGKATKARGGKKKRR